MPALQAILDFGLRQVSEPGFRKSINSRTLGSQGGAQEDGTSPSFLWRPPLAQTTMLRPLCLNTEWLNSTNALPWMIRLADLDVNPTDASNGFIFENAGYGNTASPWIYHIATVPDGFFPAVPAPHEFPTVGPSLLGVDPGISAGEPSLLNAEVRPTAGYALPAVVPPAGSEPAPVKVVDATTARTIGQTKTPLLANQPLYLRWVHSQSQLGFPPVYRFYIGQFCLIVKDSVCQVYADDSGHGDRTHFRHVQTLPLWGGGENANDDSGPGDGWHALMHPVDYITHERSLLWIPMRRNQVLMIGSPGGNARLLQVRPDVKRLPDGSDWDIVRSDKLIVWVLSPTWGRFQIQRVAYGAGGVANAPPLLLDYTPATPPAYSLAADQDHGTSIAVTQTSPPSYSLPINNAVECPNVPATIASYQARQYGYQLAFSSGGGGAWTPFYYNLLVHKEPAFVNSTATPLTVADTTAGSPSANQATLVEVKCSLGRKPGEGRAEVNLWDYSNYPLTPYYYRSGYPIQVKNGTTPVFTGYVMTPGVMPLKVAPGARRMTLTVADRWHQLTRTYLRDNGNWAGTGHIDVVQNIMQQAGVDITGMDTPPKTAAYNQVLGSAESESNANEEEGNFLSPWQPKPAENAATFLRRIAEHFSGWDIGFQADGTPFYLPKYFYTSIEARFYETAAAATADGRAGSPLYKEVSFSEVEPEANIILVKGTGRNKAGPLYSSLFIDFASILNPNVVNYIGIRKPEVVEIAGMYSCRGINWAARTIWMATRRRHVIRRIECAWNAAVKVGHCISIHPYGDHRVISYSCRFHKSGHQRMEVEAELVEKGYGLP